MHLDRKFYPEVDKLKAFAAVLVVLTHVLANYKGEGTGYNIAWELIHFSVGIFVFVSGFLMSAGEVKITNSWEFLTIFLKRFNRIVLPYYTFAILFLLSMLLMGRIGEVVAKLDFRYVFDTIFLIGGVGNNWIPRLFIILTTVSLVLNWITKSKYTWYSLFLFLSILFSAVTLFLDINILDKASIVFGWFIIYISGYFLQKHYSTENLRFLFRSTAIMTVIILGILYSFKLSLSIFHNEYPPTPYFVVYNLATISLSWIILQRIAFKGVFNSIVTWLARYSYEIFFYHLIILYVFLRGIHINVFIDLIIVLGFTVLMILSMKGLKAFFWSFIPKKSI
ncbi:acyltransferase [Candidatus Dojkabacteria bacterium]|nr:acyltransferase [Candidatus Dojkabacteria bacterium]